MLFCCWFCPSQEEDENNATLSNELEAPSSFLLTSRLLKDYRVHDSFGTPVMEENCKDKQGENSMKRRSQKLFARHHHQQQASPFLATPPLIKDDGMSTTLLTRTQMLELRRVLPIVYRYTHWERLYTFEHHGASLEQMNDQLTGQQAVLLVIRVTDGSTIGALIISDPPGWRVDSCAKRYFGTGESFLFAFRAASGEKRTANENGQAPKTQTPDSVQDKGKNTDDEKNLRREGSGDCVPCVFPWTGKNHQIVTCTPDFFGIGGGGGFGIWLDADLLRGCSTPSPTFGNEESLCSEEFFDVLAVEAWTFSNHPPSSSSSSLTRSFSSPRPRSCTNPVSLFSHLSTDDCSSSGGVFHLSRGNTSM